MKIMLNQQGFAQVVLSQTSIETEQPTTTVNTDPAGETSNDAVTTGDTTTPATASGDSLTSDGSNNTTATDESEKIVHKDAPTEEATEAPTEEAPTEAVNTNNTTEDDVTVITPEDTETPTVAEDDSANTGDGTTDTGTSTGGGDMAMGGGYYGGYGDDEDVTDMGDATTQKSTVMSSWPFVIGISSATLVVSIVFGILLAKKRIKKGFDKYED